VVFLVERKKINGDDNSNKKGRVDEMEEEWDVQIVSKSPTTIMGKLSYILYIEYIVYKKILKLQQKHKIVELIFVFFIYYKVDRTCSVQIIPTHSKSNVKLSGECLLSYYKVLFCHTNFCKNAEGGRKDEIEFWWFYNLGRFSGLRYAGIGSSGYISTKQAR
jgi:hypothetical protein